jgi:putative tricarboxylic transport membrane protein
VLAGLVLSALAFVVSTFRSSVAVAERPGAGWKGIAFIAAAIAFDLLLVEWAGFVIASTGLFWLTARAFDPKHPVRDALYAVGLSVVAYMVFAHLLQLALPAGVLAGWI